MATTIDLAQMQGNVSVYDFFCENDNIPADIEKTNGSDSSFQFKLIHPKETRKECIQRVFELRTAIPKEVSLDYRVRTLHSSALAAYLCFHQVNKLLGITINGTTYNEVKFEWGNKCSGQGGQSKVDVALFNREKKQILLLEAKFSEYLNTGSNELKPFYRENYKSLIDELLPGRLVFEGDKIRKRDPKNGACYCEGIKQMICHYIGANNMLEIEEFADCEIKIGELLFEFPETKNERFNKARAKKLKGYKELYQQLAQKVNGRKDTNISFLPEVITYQQVFENNQALLLTRVKDYYRL